jgi:aspartyl protease
MKFLTAILLAAPCSAFYPYHFTDTPDPPTTTSRIRRSDSLTSLRFPLRAVKRSNNFSISKADPPSQANSAGIDQDGTDISYMVEIQFGSGKKTLYLLLDSAAVNTWIMGSSCTVNACNIHNTYGPSDSSSLQVFQFTIAS